MKTNTLTLTTDIGAYFEQLVAEVKKPLWLSLLPADDRNFTHEQQSWIYAEQGSTAVRQSLVDAFNIQGTDQEIYLESNRRSAVDPQLSLGQLLAIAINNHGSLSGLIKLTTQGRQLIKDHRYLSLIFIYDQLAQPMLQLNEIHLSQRANWQISPTQVVTAAQVPSMSQQIEEALQQALLCGAITAMNLDYHRICCQQEGGLVRFQQFIESGVKTKR